MTDERFELWISRLLRTGVVTAAAIVALGGIGNLIENGRATPAYHHFHGEPETYTSAQAILGAARHFDWPAVIQFGLLVLIATPVARVALAILGFSAERDWTYVGITVLVLAILLFSLFWADG